MKMPNSLRSELQELKDAAEAYAGRAYLFGSDQHVSWRLRRALDNARAALDRETCQHCEYFDHGDCLNRLAPRFQTEPEMTCDRWTPDSTAAQAKGDAAEGHGPLTSDTK